MIAALRGAVEHKTVDSAFLAVGGVTFRVYAPLTTLSHLEIGAAAKLFTYLQVREDALTLFGFITETDRDLFVKLTSVSGVGPSIGLALLSSMSAAALQEAIMTEDLTRLTMAKGVGRKLAARLVLELRPQMEKLHSESGLAPITGPVTAGSSRMQVLDALTTLGYGQAEAAAAVRALPDDATGTVEELIMLALRSLARD